jgi:hypothetical protein
MKDVSELGKILEVLVLKYDFGRTRTQRAGTRTQKSPYLLSSETLSRTGNLRFVSSHSELRTCVRVFGNEFLSLKVYDRSS